METLFGIRSNVAIITVACIYLIISLHISIHEFRYFKESSHSLDDDHQDGGGDADDHSPNGYLLIDTNKDSFHIISLVLSLSCLLSTILLILGVLEKRYGLIRPWLLFNFVLKCIFVSISIYFALLFVEVHKRSWFNACGLLVVIFFASVAAAYHIYLWNGIYSLYEKFRKQSWPLYRVPSDGEDSMTVHTV